MTNRSDRNAAFKFIADRKVSEISPETARRFMTAVEWSYRQNFSRKVLYQVMEVVTDREMDTLFLVFTDQANLYFTALRTTLSKSLLEMLESKEVLIFDFDLRPKETEKEVTYFSLIGPGQEIPGVVSAVSMGQLICYLQLTAKEACGRLTRVMTPTNLPFLGSHDVKKETQMNKAIFEINTYAPLHKTPGPRLLTQINDANLFYKYPVGPDWEKDGCLVQTDFQKHSLYSVLYAFTDEARRRIILFHYDENVWTAVGFEMKNFETIKYILKERVHFQFRFDTAMPVAPGLTIRYLNDGEARVINLDEVKESLGYTKNDAEIESLTILSETVSELKADKEGLKHLNMLKLGTPEAFREDTNVPLLVYRKETCKVFYIETKGQEASTFCFSAENYEDLDQFVTFITAHPKTEVRLTMPNGNFESRLTYSDDMKAGDNTTFIVQYVFPDVFLEELNALIEEISSCLEIEADCSARRKMFQPEESEVLDLLSETIVELKAGEKGLKALALLQPQTPVQVRESTNVPVFTYHRETQEVFFVQTLEDKAATFGFFIESKKDFDKFIDYITTTPATKIEISKTIFPSQARVVYGDSCSCENVFVARFLFSNDTTSKLFKLTEKFISQLKVSGSTADLSNQPTQELEGVKEESIKLIFAAGDTSTFHTTTAAIPVYTEKFKPLLPFSQAYTRDRVPAFPLAEDYFLLVPDSFAVIENVLVLFWKGREKNAMVVVHFLDKDGDRILWNAIESGRYESKSLSYFVKLLSKLEASLIGFRVNLQGEVQLMREFTHEELIDYLDEHRPIHEEEEADQDLTETALPVAVTEHTASIKLKNSDFMPVYWPLYQRLIDVDKGRMSVKIGSEADYARRKLVTLFAEWNVEHPDDIFPRSQAVALATELDNIAVEYGHTDGQRVLKRIMLEVDLCNVKNPLDEIRFVNQKDTTQVLTASEVVERGLASKKLLKTFDRPGVVGMRLVVKPYFEL